MARRQADDMTTQVRGSPLRPGRDQAVFTAVDSAGKSAPRSLSFTIVKR